MEADRSDQSTDESSAKRLNIETENATSSKSNTNDDCPILALPADVLAKIIVKIPIAQWTALELVESFRPATLIAWRQLRHVNVDQEFVISPENGWMDEDRSSFIFVESILQKLVDCAPFLTSLSGIKEWNWVLVPLLARFEHLQSITVGDSNFCNGRQQIALENVVAFLESTRSRTSLKEVRLSGMLQPWDYCNTIMDRFASSFVSGRVNEWSSQWSSQRQWSSSKVQLPLKLEKFSLMVVQTDYLHCIRLDTMDATRLIDLRLGMAPIEPSQLTNLIERASNLRRIELSFLNCRTRPCKAPRLQDNKKLLAAISSLERLTAIKFDGYTYDKKCMDFEYEFLQMLKTIGRRGQLRKLALEDYFEIFDVNGVCAAIHKEIPYLKSIKLNGRGITEETLCKIFGLTELEEIYFNNSRDRMTTESAIRKISQLPHLKRFGFEESSLAGLDTNSTNCLANATTLTDLRIRYAHWIYADVFDKWSDGFASNLQTLMLGAYDVKYEQGLVRFLEKAVRLRVLILRGDITDDTLMAIAKSCPALEILCVESYSNQISVGHLQEIVDRCPKLKRLGGFEKEIDRNQLRFPKYRKIADVHMEPWKDDFDDDEYD